MDLLKSRVMEFYKKEEREPIPFVKEMEKGKKNH